MSFLRGMGYAALAGTIIATPALINYYDTRGNKADKLTRTIGEKVSEGWSELFKGLFGDGTSKVIVRAEDGKYYRTTCNLRVCENGNGFEIRKKDGTYLKTDTCQEIEAYKNNNDKTIFKCKVGAIELFIPIRKKGGTRIIGVYDKEDIAKSK